MDLPPSASQKRICQTIYSNTKKNICLFISQVSKNIVLLIASLFRCLRSMVFATPTSQHGRPVCVGSASMVNSLCLLAIKAGTRFSLGGTGTNEILSVKMCQIELQKIITYLDQS